MLDTGFLIQKRNPVKRETNEMKMGRHIILKAEFST
jgi:hypothetical protein